MFVGCMGMHFQSASGMIMMCRLLIQQKVYKASYILGNDREADSRTKASSHSKCTAAYFFFACLLLPVSFLSFSSAACNLLVSMIASM